MLSWHALRSFYRSSDMSKELPKYFQIGTVVEGAGEGGLSKKARKASILQEHMADITLRKRAKRQCASPCCRRHEASTLPCGPAVIPCKDRQYWLSRKRSPL